MPTVEAGEILSMMAGSVPCWRHRTYPPVYGPGVEEANAKPAPLRTSGPSLCRWVGPKVCNTLMPRKTTAAPPTTAMSRESRGCERISVAEPGDPDSCTCTAHHRRGLGPHPE